MGRLRRIVLDNFMSFGHVELDLLDKGSPKGSALIYGENGSGKTNLVESVRFLRDSTLTAVNSEEFEAIRADMSRCEPRRFPDDPKRQDLEDAMFHLMRYSIGMGPRSLGTMGRTLRLIGSDGPMRLGFEFDTGSAAMWYDMEFSVSGELIGEEMAEFTKGARTRRLFLVKRTDGDPEASFGKSVFSAEMSRTLRRRISASWGSDSLLAIIRSEMQRGNPGFIKSSICSRIRDSIGFIGSISVDVEGFGPTGMWPDGLPIESGAVDAGTEPRLRAYGRAASSYLVRLYSDIKGAGYDLEDMGNGRVAYELMVEKVIAGQRRRIPFKLESAGTRKLLGMLPTLLTCARGGAAFIDEFDSGIHDRIVHDMLGQIIGDLSGQLVLTTHNTLLLETADPSDVYVIRTDIDGFKEIRTFASIAPTRKGHHNNRQRYLDGLFDGIPLIRELDLPGIAERLSGEIGDQE